VDLSFYKFIIDSLPVALVAMNSEFNIIEFNPWAEKVTGYASEEVLGRHCWEILQSGMCDSHCPLRKVMAQSTSTISDTTTIHDRDGRIIPVRFNAAALFDAEGRLIGGVEAFFDISKLVAMERERANVISMLAHDIRSSLTGIHGIGLRLLRKPDDLDPEKERKHLDIITKEAAKLESLIDDFIEFSRIESGNLTLNITATSLDKELEELFELYKDRAAQHGVRLQLQVENILPVIEADANRLRRALINLLDNAIKYSKQNGTVTIIAQEKDREVMVTVADDGIGMDSEDIPHIFDIFHRGKKTAGKTGHGLGLATVKAIVEGHGGRILVSSRPNEGSTFTILLPIKDDGKSSLSGAVVSPT
jgi:PAS domain S-box-containing protein